jgi:GntR family transcriptional regulator
MVIELNFRSGKPVYLQVVDQIKSAVAAGGLRTGEALPSIRPLAEQLRINRNTVAKAYAELEGQGVIETMPGKGSVVTPNNSPFKKEVRYQMVCQEIDAAIVQAHHLQVPPQEFLTLVEQRLSVFQQKLEASASGV